MWKIGIKAAVAIITISLIGLVVYIVGQRKPSLEKEGDRVLTHLSKHYPIPDDFNSAEMKSLKRRALLGDEKAADALREIYSNCVGHYQVPNAPRPNISEAECTQAHYYWVNVSAVNGSLSGIMQQYNFQSESNNCQDVYRARYWLSKIPPERMLKEPWASEAKRQAQREKACGW